MIHELDLVRTCVDGVTLLDGTYVPAGTEGTVIHMSADGQHVMVEFESIDPIDIGDYPVAHLELVKPITALVIDGPTRTINRWMK